MRVAIAFNALIVLSALTARAADQSFALADAVQIALERSPKIRALIAKVDEARSTVGANRSTFMPHIGFAGGLERNPSVSDTAEKFAYAYAHWNLFNGFADRQNSQIGGLALEIAETELAAEQFSLALEVEETFYSVLGAMKSAQEWADAGAINGNALKDIRARRGAGMISEGDVVAFEVRQTRLDAEIAEAQSEIAMSKTEFNRLLGHEIGQSIVFQGEVPRFEMSETPETLLANAHRDSFTLRASSLDVARASVELSKWVSETLPKIDLEARNGLLPLGERASAKEAFARQSTYILVTAKMDLFSGLSTVYDRRAAAARKSKSDEELRQASSDLLTTIERHARKIQSLDRRIVIESDNSLKASKYKEIIAREYRGGVKPISDYAAAIDLLIDARRRLVTALLQWHHERFGLERALGRKISVKEVH